MGFVMPPFRSASPSSAVATCKAPDILHVLRQTGDGQCTMSVTVRLDDTHHLRPFFQIIPHGLQIILHCIQIYFRIYSAVAAHLFCSFIFFIKRFFSSDVPPEDRLPASRARHSPLQMPRLSGHGGAPPPLPRQRLERLCQQGRDDARQHIPATAGGQGTASCVVDPRLPVRRRRYRSGILHDAHCLKLPGCFSRCPGNVRRDLSHRGMQKSRHFSRMGRQHTAGRPVARTFSGKPARSVSASASSTSGP